MAGVFLLGAPGMARSAMTWRDPVCCGGGLEDLRVKVLLPTEN